MNTRELIDSIMKHGTQKWKLHLCGIGSLKQRAFYYCYENSILEMLEVEQKTYVPEGFKTWNIHHIPYTTEVGIFPKHTESPTEDIDYALTFLEEVAFVQRFLIAHLLSYDIPPGKKYYLNTHKPNVVESSMEETYPLDPNIHACIMNRIKDAVYFDEDVCMIIPCMLEMSLTLPKSAHKKIQAMKEYDELLAELQTKTPEKLFKDGSS